MATKIFVSAIDGMTNFTAADVTGVETAFLTDEGVVFEDATDYQVTAQSSPNMSVQVAKGTCYVKRDGHVNSDGSQKYWQVVMDGITTPVAITTADPSNPRIDLVCVKVDTGALPNPDADNVGSIIVVAGTPAGSPSRPAIPNNYCEIGQIAVGTGVTTITNSNITDTRVIATIKATLVPGIGFQQGGMRNGKITTAVASNNLTVSLKTLAGNDPSPSDPVYIRIGNTVRKITAALSVTLNAGTNYMGVGSVAFATFEVDYFVYLGWDATNSQVRICFSRVPYGRVFSEFSAVTTAELYLAKSGTLSATDELENIGRFNAILSAAASYNWSIPGTSIIITRPIFKTRWLTWQPSYSASGIMTFISVSTDIAQYQITEDKLDYNLSCLGTTGGTANSSLLFNPPIAIGAGDNLASNIEGYGNQFDGGGTDDVAIVYKSTASQLAVFKAPISNFGLGATRGFRIKGNYRLT